MVASRGPEPIKVGRLRREGPTSTVPGEGRVTEDMEARKAAQGRSAAEYTKPQTEKMGG